MTHNRSILSAYLFITACATAHGQTITDRNKSLAQLCDGDSSCEKAALKQVAKSRAEKAGSAKPLNTTNKSKTTPFALPTLSIPTPGQQCQDATQQLFIRKDSTDNFDYLANVKGMSGPASANAAGASFNYTDDIEAANQKATFNFRASYLLIGKHDCKGPLIGAGPETETRYPYMFGLAFAPFVSSDGTWNEPFTTTTTTTKTTNAKTSGPPITTVKRTNDATTVTTVTTSNGTTTTTTKKTSTSAVRVGADFQYALNTLTWPIQQSFFYASPFYQTDVRGAAEIGGADLWWSPVSQQIFLGVGATPPYFSFFWQFKGEAELTQVSNPGYTDFSPGGHAQFGEQIRPHLNFFPLSSGVDYPDWVNSWIAGRLSFIGTQQYYFDAASKQAAPYYTAQLQYKIGQCQKTNTSDSDNTDVTSKSDSTQFNSECSGTSTLSLEYDWGKDKDTYVKYNQFLVKLTFAY